MEELKKCPFCGSKLKTVMMYGYWEFECENNSCILHETSNRKYNSEEELIRAINTHKPMERIVERLEQQERQYNRRAKEFLTLGEKVYHEKHYAKACSYNHAIKIVKEEME